MNLSEHPFPPGTKVETNEEYFDLLGRRVAGTVVHMFPDPPNTITVMRWEHQEGNIIPEHTGNAVLMMTKDLQKVQTH